MECLVPRKRKPIVPMKYPVGQEYAYRRILLTLTLQQKKLLKKHFAPKISEMAKEATAIHLPTGMIRQDALGWQDTLRNILDRIAHDMTVPTNKAIRDAVTQIGPGTNRYNKAEWQKLIHSQYGVKPTAEDPLKYEHLMREWSINNAALIKDIPAKSIKQIADMTTEALITGTVQSDVEQEIIDILGDRMDVSDSRAKLIARDQVSKLNGQLTEERQTDLGVESYIWRTVGDERVRDEHEQNDGETFEWSSPPPETGHPGEDYQCRCWAEPILPEFIAFQASLAEMEDA